MGCLNIVIKMLVSIKNSQSFCKIYCCLLWDMRRKIWIWWME